MSAPPVTGTTLPPVPGPVSHRRLRIAHVTDFYLPRCGGIELQVRDLAAHQVAAGHRVTVLTSTPPPADEDLAVGGELMVHRLAESGTMPGWRAPVRAALRDVLRAGRFDVVHVHGAPWTPLAFTATSMASERPTVFTMHSILGAVEPGARLSRSLCPWPSWPVVWTAVSEVAAAPLRGMLGEIPVHVLPNGVEVGAWRVPPAPRADNDVVAVAVMRLTGRKRAMQLLRIFRDARARLDADVRLRLLVLGDGPLRPRMQRWLTRHQMNSEVVLAGVRTRADVRRALARADVFLAPAVLESFGIAALEARCAGVPVLARAQSGTVGFIEHDREGMLAVDDSAMAAHLAALAADPARRAAIAAHNRAVPPPLDWDTVLRRTHDLYALADRAAPIPSPVAR
jgi:glycosyltransferase involved in cell wall biosynthesis